VSELCLAQSKRAPREFGADSAFPVHTRPSLPFPPIRSQIQKLKELSFAVDAVRERWQSNPWYGNDSQNPNLLLPDIARPKAGNGERYVHVTGAFICEWFLKASDAESKAFSFLRSFTV
jgi:hypothetical protein